jgi:hypothetical protein
MIYKPYTIDADLCTLFESPLHIVELEDAIPIVESFYTTWKRSIMLSHLVGAADIGGAAEIGGSDSVESSCSIIQEKK